MTHTVLWGFYSNDCACVRTWKSFPMNLCREDHVMCWAMPSTHICSTCRERIQSLWRVASRTPVFAAGSLAAEWWQKAKSTSTPWGGSAKRCWPRLWPLKVSLPPRRKCRAVDLGLLESCEGFLAHMCSWGCRSLSDWLVSLMVCCCSSPIWKCYWPY